MSNVRWDEIKRSMSRNIKSNWTLFKQSKLGLTGIGIIIFFLVLAIFAPLIPFTYSVDYLAPAGDLFYIDNTTVSIPTQHHWASPVSIQTPQGVGKPAKIAGVWIYSQDGVGYLFPRNFTYAQKLRVENPVKEVIPANMTGMKYLISNKKIVGFDNRAVYLYPVPFERNGKDINTLSFMKNPEIVEFNHTLKYVSNVWDSNVTNPTSGTADATIFMAMGSNKTVSLLLVVKGELSGIGGFGKITYGGTYMYNFTVNSTIVANPSVDFNYRSGQNWVIIPTADYVYRYDVNLLFNYTTTGKYISGISGVHEIWKYPMQHGNMKYQFVSPESLTLVYPKSDQASIGKNILVGLCKNNRAFGLYTKNGTEIWNDTLHLNPSDPRIHTLKMTAVSPSVMDYVIVSGTTNVGGVVAELSPRTGKIMQNMTSYMILRGTINYVSSFDYGSSTYYVSTVEGNIYQVNMSFYTQLKHGAYLPVGLAKSFSVLGGAETQAVFLGNTIMRGNLYGAYVGVITKHNTLYLQASGGTRISTIVVPPFSYGRMSHNFYLFGTDYEGHDIWTWLVYGARTSLLVGLTAAIISVLVGTFIGIISGFYGGWIDTVIMRTVDIILTLPGLVIMLLLAAVLGPNIWNIVMIISVLGWAGIARIIRAVTLSLKNRPFMDAARVAGASNPRMITVHIFPNVLPLTFLYMTFGVSGAILAQAALAFLGMGDPNAVSWGMMLQYLRMYGQLTNVYAWGWLIMPGVFIALISLSFYLVGRAFDEIVNPRLRKR